MGLLHASDQGTIVAVQTVLQQAVLALALASCASPGPTTLAPPDSDQTTTMVDAIREHEAQFGSLPMKIVDPADCEALCRISGSYHALGELASTQEHGAAAACARTLRAWTSEQAEAHDELCITCTAHLQSTGWWLRPRGPTMRLSCVEETVAD
jgi:hypothetical protein